ncbi:MAG TPA: phosphoribosylformylglycinamidine synthase subunit PurS, partial [Pyrinomonadaceae bacterium]|nr:phosphoribosylformylglycinamidine synthase subunit PurS [Pyrinomonadaceae bacterium]
RTIPFPPFVMDALREHKQKQDEWRRVCGDGYNDYGLVFTTKSGLPIDQRNLRYAFKRRILVAGLPTDFRLYELRHSCASLLLAANVHPKTVSERLGHGSVIITLDVYSHVLPGIQAAASEQLEQILAGDTPATHQRGQEQINESRPRQMSDAKLLTDKAHAQNVAERMAREVLANPVIEDYRVEVEG